MSRFSQKGNTRAWFVPTIASLTRVPTASEVNAGTKLDPQMAEINGFTFANEPIKTPVMRDSFDAQIPGQDNTDTSSMSFWEDKVAANNPIKTALTKGMNGYVVIFYAGIASGSGAAAAADKCEVWPVTVSSVARRYTTANEAAQYMISFAMTEPPAVDVAVTV